MMRSIAVCANPRRYAGTCARRRLISCCKARTLEGNIPTERLVELFTHAGLYPVAQGCVSFTVLQDAPSGSGEIVLESVSFDFSVDAAQESFREILGVF